MIGLQKEIQSSIFFLSVFYLFKMMIQWETLVHADICLNFLTGSDEMDIETSELRLNPHCC